MAFGAEKYGRDNWLNGLGWTCIVSAVLRHIFAWIGGERRDKESGYNPLAHAICGLMFLIVYEKNSLGTDDRPKYKGVKK